MEENYIVTEITEEELDQLDHIPSLNNAAALGLCSQCSNSASKVGFVVRNDQGSMLKIHFKRPMCDQCARREVVNYSGWNFERWL